MKIYLGDSVYVEYDGNRIILTTENGVGPSNTIYIEPEVWASLERFVADLRASLLANSADEIEENP